jgi:hypothetical protein
MNVNVFDGTEQVALSAPRHTFDLLAGGRLRETDRRT